jgi:hypothetical protein
VQGLPPGLTHQINRVTGYWRQANRVIYPVYPVGVRPLSSRVRLFAGTCGDAWVLTGYSCHVRSVILSPGQLFARRELPPRNLVWCTHCNSLR